MTGRIAGLEAHNANLFKNLGEVVAREASVAEFCRRVGINRQQFNKYLAGTHAPSRRNLTRIAEQCGLKPDDFLLPPATFEKRMNDQASSAISSQLATPFEKFESFARGSVAGLKPFLGTYFRYHHSPTFPGFIIRAVTILYLLDGVVRYVTVERLPVQTDNNKERYSFTYRGICYMMGSRIFMCDYEHKQLNEMSAAILMPQVRNPIRHMFGLLTGVTATTYGQPFSSKVVFERKDGDSSIRRSVLRQATLLTPADPQIPVAVRNYIGDSDANVLLASA